jgi:Ca2+/Na+ antiporter
MLRSAQHDKLIINFSFLIAFLLLLLLFLISKSSDGYKEKAEKEILLCSLSFRNVIVKLQCS